MEKAGPALNNEMIRDHRSATSVLALCIALSAMAQPPPGYYDPAVGLTGAALKVALNGIISPHTAHSYGQLWNDFQSTDVRGDGKVWDIYSDRPDSISPYAFAFITDQCGNYDSEGDCYNREHSVPQSWFNSGTPMVTDLHHIYPTDGWVNNKRGDLPYGEVGSPDWTSLNGSTLGYSITPGYPYTVFEPIDAFKGDLARTYFYMMTRYLPDVGGWNSPMFSSGDLGAWARNMLLAWNDADPVSQKEIDRNNAIYAIQGNRNPYIDHPEWAHFVWTSTVGLLENQPMANRLWFSDGSLCRSNGREWTTVDVFGADGRSLFSAPFQGEQLVLPDMPPGLYIARSGPDVLRFVR